MEEYKIENKIKELIINKLIHNINNLKNLLVFEKLKKYLWKKLNLKLLIMAKVINIKVFKKIPTPIDRKTYFKVMVSLKK